MHHSAFNQNWQSKADECDQRAQKQQRATTVRYDATAKPLSPLRIGSSVSVQNTDTGLWDRTGTIVAIGQRRTYFVKLPSGRTLWRNRRFLRPLRPITPTLERETSQPAERPAAAPAAAPPSPPPRLGAADLPSPAPVPAPRVRFSSPEAEIQRHSRQRRQPHRLVVDPSRQSYC